MNGGKLDAVKARQRAEEMRDQFLEWYYMEFKDVAKASANSEEFAQIDREESLWIGIDLKADAKSTQGEEIPEFA